MFSLATVFLGFLSTGCTTTEVLVDHNFYGCENVDPSALPEATLDVTRKDLQFTVTRAYAYAACDADFDPDLSLEGTHLEVVEKWTGGDAEACETCFMAEVVVKNPEPGDYSIDWTLPGSDEIWEQVEFTVD